MTNWNIGLFFLTCLWACASAPERSVELEPYEVANWFTTWEGDQPDYPLVNADGDVVVIQGKEAKVSGSHFQFALQAQGTVQLLQTHDDGRRAEFTGTWKGQLSPATGALQAVVCDLAAVSTGAYRQYALMADSINREVRCYGTSKEPSFAVAAVTP